MMQNTIYLTCKLESIVGIQGMHQTNTNFGEEYLIPDAMTNDFGVLEQ
jgi:iron complex outermembrane receptor protein